MNQKDLAQLSELATQRQVLRDYLKNADDEGANIRFTVKHRVALKYVLDHDQSQNDRLTQELHDLETLLDRLEGLVMPDDGHPALQAVSRLNRRATALLGRLGERHTQALTDPYAADDATLPQAEQGDL